MNLTAYDLVVRISAQVTGLSSGVSTALSLLGRLQTSMTAATLSSARLRGGLTSLAAGLAVFGAGMAGVGILKGWVGAAGEMQDALAQVGNAARGTQKELTALQSLSYTVAGQTQFSAPQVLDMAKLMGTHGFKDLSGKLDPVAAITQALPEIAKAAEVAYRMTGQSYAQTVPALVKQAHQFGQYSGAAFNRDVETAVRASIASGMTLTQQTNVLRYLMPAVKSLGISSTDAYTLTALANQVGLTQGKGGSNLGAFYRQLLPIGSAAHKSALQEIFRDAGGQHFFDAKGNYLGDLNALELINRFRDTKGISPGLALATLTHAFGVQGGQAAAALTTDSALKQYTALHKQLLPYDPIKNPTGIADVTTMQLKLNQTLVGQMNTLNTNMSSLKAMLGDKLLPVLLPILKTIVQITSGLLGFGQQHQGVVQFVATFTAIATAAALIAGPVLIAAGAIAILSAAGVTLTLGFLPITALILGVVAAIGVFTVVALHWRDALDAINGRLDVFKKFGTVGGLVAAGLEAAFSPVMAMAQGVQKLIDAYTWFEHLVTKQPATSSTGDPAQTGLAPGTYVQNGELYRTSGYGHFAQTQDLGPYVPANAPHTDPRRAQHAARHGGNAVGTGGGGGITIGPIHVHGADHATTEHLANAVVAKINAAMTEAVRYGSVYPRGLELGPAGY